MRLSKLSRDLCNRSFLLLVIMLLTWHLAEAQPNLVAAEYFFNNDPGPGNGTPISITAGTTLDIANLNIPTTSLAVGWHTICIRAKDADNVWGFYECRKIYVRELPPVIPPPVVYDVTAMEYFFNTDNGLGTGTTIPVTSGPVIDVPNFDVTTTSLPVGWHTVHVRPKNQNNVWGFYESRAVFVRGAPTPVVFPPPSPITAMEFFYDTDSGPGTGQAITVTTGLTVDIPTTDMANALPLGWHTVHVRTKNQNNVWGFYESRTIFARSAPPPPPPPAPNIVQFEYFVDTDPGVGLSSFTLSKPPATTFDLVNEPLNIGTISLGAHKAGIRAQDANGKWSMTELANFTVTSPCTIITPPSAPNTSRCDPGTVSITAGGAGGGQTYRWYPDNTTLTQLFTGNPFVTPSLSVNTNYFVSVYDPVTFCESSRTQVTAIVTGIPKPTLNLTGSLAVCQGNSVTLVAPVGFSSYLWSNGLTTQQITAATSGSYTVTVGNGTCTSPVSDPFTLTVNINPVKPIINATGGGSLCGTGSVTLSAPAGFTTYSWSSGQSTQNIIVNAIGNFTVTVTNSNGCQSVPSDVFTVTNSTIPKPLTTVTGNTALCNSSTVTLDAPLGFTGYAWSNGATTQQIIVSTAGNYSVTVSNSGCNSPASDAVPVTSVAIPSKPVITASGPVALCNGSSVFLSAPNGFSSYLWSTGETTRVISVSAAGNYSAQVGNAGNCLSVASDATTVTLTGQTCVAVTVPSPTVTNGSRCGPGTVTLNASGASGGQVYRWYDAPTSGTLLFTGASFTSPSLSSSTIYYAAIYDPALTVESVRVTASATIVNIATPTIAGPGSLSICSGSSTLLSAPTGYLQYLWSNGANTQQIQISTAGNYSVQVGDGTCLSLASNSIAVSVAPAIAKPTISVTGNTILCGSSTVLLSAVAGYSYAWSNGATTQSITVSTAGNYSVTLSNGTCTSPASDPVSVSTVLISSKPAIAASGSTALCPGAFVILTAPTSPVYLWSTGETSRQIVVSTAGSYYVQVGNAVTCLSVASDPTVTTTATCVGIPSAPSVTNASICGPGSVILTAAGVTGGQTYKWYDAPTSGNLVNTGPSFTTPTLAATTSYYVTIFDPTNGESTPAMAIATIVNFPAPVLTGPGSITICTGSTTLLSAPNGFIQYLWSNGVTTQQNLVSTPGSYSVQVGNGTCLSPASNTVVVSVSPLLSKPPVTINGNTTFCGSGSVDLIAPTGFQYLWSTGANTRQITVTTTGNYSVTISNGICTSPASDDIIVTSVAQPAKPSIAITGATALCNNAFVALEAPAGFASYLWSNGETIRRIVVSSTSPGNYSVQVGNAATCLSISSDAVSVTATGQSCGSTVLPPAPPTASNNARCGPGTVALSGNGATGIQEYHWYDVASGGISLFTGAIFTTPLLASSTNYYLALYDLATAMESSRVMVTASVINFAKPVVNPSGAQTICVGTSIVLSAPSGFTQYLWSNGETTQQLQVTTTGKYSVQVSNGTCLSSSSDDVVINVSTLPAKPVVAVSGGSTSFCSTGGSVELSGPAGVSYLWSNGATSQSITLTESAVITLIIKNTSGCASPASDPIVVTKLLPPCKPNTPPFILPIVISAKIEGSVTVDLTKYITDAEDNIDYTRLHTLTSSTGKGAPAVIDGAYNLTIDYKGILFSGPDRITIEVFDLYNLRAQRVIEIDVVGEVVVFNGITPDGDGINDFFYIKYLDVIEGGLKNKVSIFNRWGDVVFDISDYNNIDRVFNGIGNNGSQLSPGTYFFRVDFANTQPVTGYITLKP